MDYLVENMGLSVYDVLTFPAYFSYPLDTVIEPRTEFLSIRWERRRQRCTAVSQPHTMHAYAPVIGVPLRVF